MRHVMLACLVLALCLAFCIFSACHIRAICGHTLSLLSRAEAFAQGGDFPSCRRAIIKAGAHWQRYERWFGLTLTHEQVDQILERFAALSQYAALSDRDDFLAGCAELSAALSHIQKMELPTYDNIL